MVRKSGEVLEPIKCCRPPAKSRSYVFAADSAFTPKVVNAAMEATLLYHEATFMDKEKEIAKKTMHSTAADAACEGWNCVKGTETIDEFLCNLDNLSLEEWEKLFLEAM